MKVLDAETFPTNASAMERRLNELDAAFHRALKSKAAGVRYRRTLLRALHQSRLFGQHVTLVTYGLGSSVHVPSLDSNNSATIEKHRLTPAQ